MDWRGGDRDEIRPRQANAASPMTCHRDRLWLLLPFSTPQIPYPHEPDWFSSKCGP